MKKLYLHVTALSYPACRIVNKIFLHHRTLFTLHLFIIYLPSIVVTSDRPHRMDNQGSSVS